MLRANSRSISNSSSIASKAETPRVASKLSTVTNELKSVSSKETTKIPKPKSYAKDTKSPQARGNGKPPEDKKFSIRRPSKTGVPEKPDAITKADVCNRPSTTSSLGKSVQNFGKVPTYLKRANSIKRESDAADKVKAFNALKTKLRDAQTQFFKALGNVKQTQPDGLQEEYKFIALIKDGDGKLIMDDHKDVPKIDGGSENKSFLSIKEKLSLMTKDVNMLLCTISEQLRTLQKHPSEAELTDIKDDFSDLQDKIESISSANKSHTVEVIKLLNDMADSSNMVVREIDNQELESKLHNLTDVFETTKRKLDIAEGKLAEFKLKDQAKSRVHDLESKTKEKQFVDKDKELVKFRNEIKTLEEQKHKATNEVSKLKLKVKSMEAELSQFKVNMESIADIENLRSNLKIVEQKEGELQTLYQEEKSCNRKLQEELKDKQDELSTSLITLETLKAQCGGDNGKISELTNEIRMLQFEKDDLKEEKGRLEEEKIMLIKDFETSNVNLQVELSNAIDQLKALEITNEDLKNRLSSVEESLKKKNELVLELEAKNEELTSASKSKEMQNELAQLREANMIKNREIGSLKIELAKTIHEIKQREEEISLYQRVLKVRSELINSMQEKEESSELKISDLHSEMNRQSNYITRINNELSEKSEELQDIFSNLEKKKVELARQEQIMKQLEESNQKNFEIQKSQVLRIQQLDAELDKMKEAVQVYEHHLLGINDSNRNNISNRQNRVFKKN